VIVDVRVRGVFVRGFFGWRVPLETWGKGLAGCQVSAAGVVILVDR
jgi:hypothetical protein